MSELNSRQWALYNFLKERGDDWTCQWQIALEVPEYGYDGESEAARFHDSRARQQMTADIRAINDSSVIQKIIISSPKGIKLANSDEFNRYIQKEINAAVRRLLRAKRKRDKGNRDGQMRITFRAERDTVKAFIDSDKKVGERLRNARIAKKLLSLEVVKIANIKGFDVPMLSRFENGYCLPNKSTLAKLSEIYGVTSDFILYGISSTEQEINEIIGLQVEKEA